MAARQQFLAQLRPVLSASRLEDPALKVSFGDLKWVRIPGGGAVAEIGTGDGSAGPDTQVVYLAIALRNAGSGIAVLHGWRFFPGRRRDEQHAPLAEFQRQSRDLYIPVGDIGFWQGTFRDAEAAGYSEAREAIEAREPWTVELLYGDHEGGQRTVSRFLVFPASQQGEAPEGQAPGGQAPEGRPRWLATTVRHWSIDRPDPR